jgi:hypothetical protein
VRRQPEFMATGATVLAVCAKDPKITDPVTCLAGFPGPGRSLFPSTAGVAPQRTQTEMKKKRWGACHCC